jgi:GNAT superfamily N-acetyltransferase
MKIERITTATMKDVLPLLSVQLEEHGARLHAAALERAVFGLLDVPKRGLVLAAYEGDQAIGLALMAHTWSIEHGGFCTWLDELYVIPQRRNGGIGRALLLAAIEAAKAEGCAAVDLEVENDHARVESLYLREGFTRRTRNRFVNYLRKR